MANINVWANFQNGYHPLCRGISSPNFSYLSMKLSTDKPFFYLELYFNNILNFFLVLDENWILSHSVAEMTY